MGYALFVVTFLASPFIVDYLARERVWNPSRWVWAAVVVGPLAIPLVYLADAACAIRKMINAQRS